MTQTYPKPPPTGSYVPANIPVITYNGGAFGDDVTVSTANATNTYSPRFQGDKITAGNLTPATVMVTDVGRARGAIEPGQAYPNSGTAALTAPTITSLAPNTAVTGPNKPTVAVTITGTGFTQWSTTTSGNFPIPCRYLSPTTLEIIQKPSASVPGIVSVVVTDHGVASAGSNFTFT